jgi:DNA-binding transcriptional LysR family regulator
LGQAVVLPIVLAFQQAHPELRVEAELSDRVFDLVEERIDVAVRMTDAPPPSMVARRVGDDERVFCASPAYLASRGTPESPADLARHEGIHLMGDHLPIPWRLRPKPNADPPAAYRLQSRIRLNSTEGIRMAALAGLGIADLPRYLVRADLASGRLVALLQAYQPGPRSIWAIYHPSRFVPKKVAAFVAALSFGFEASAMTKEGAAPSKPPPTRPRPAS